jgi:hypothetical protein
MNVYNSLLGNSQHANMLAIWLSWDWFSMRSVPRPLLCNRSVNMFQQQRECFLCGRCRSYIMTLSQRMDWNPCGGGVEYLHHDPASCRRRRKGKSQIWDSKIRSQVPRDYEQERLHWQGPAAHTKDRPVLSSERASHRMKNITVRRIPYSERKKKSGRKPRMGALYQDRLADWPSVVT